MNSLTGHSGRITKQRRKLDRTTLVQYTLILTRYSHYLRKSYEHLKAKKVGGKAIIVNAKKMLGIIYKTLKNDWAFEYFTNFTLAS